MTYAAHAREVESCSPNLSTLPRYGLSFGTVQRRLRKLVMNHPRLGKAAKADTIYLFDECLDREVYEATGHLVTDGTGRDGMAILIGRHGRTAERLIAKWRKIGLAATLYPGSKGNRTSIIEILLPGLAEIARDRPTFLSSDGPAKTDDRPTLDVGQKRREERTRLGSSTSPGIDTSSLPQRGAAPKKIGALSGEGGFKKTGKEEPPVPDTLPDDWQRAAAEARTRLDLPPVDLDFTWTKFLAFMRGKRRPTLAQWVKWAEGEKLTPRQLRAYQMSQTMARLARERVDREVERAEAEKARAAAWEADAPRREAEEARQRAEEAERAAQLAVDAEAARQRREEERRQWEADRPAREAAEAKAREVAEAAAKVEADRKAQDRRAKVHRLAKSLRIGFVAIHAETYFSEADSTLGDDALLAMRAELVERLQDDSDYGDAWEIAGRIETHCNAGPQILAARRKMEEARL